MTLDRLKKARDTVADLITMVPREKYLRATRGLSDARAAYHDEKAKNILAGEIITAEREMRQAVEQQRDELAAQITQIRVALGHVAVYEGMVGLQPLPLMVDGLARDHEELEARIDAVMHLLVAERARASRMERLGVQELAQEVARLLAGGARVPDTIEGVED